MQNVSKAVTLLQQAIELHEKHMDGRAPTTGPLGMKSQMEMMDMMTGALAALRGANRLTGLLGHDM